MILSGDWIIVTSDELEKPYDTMYDQIYKVTNAFENGSVIVDREGDLVELLDGEFEKVEVKHG